MAEPPGVGRGYKVAEDFAEASLRLRDRLRGRQRPCPGPPSPCGLRRGSPRYDRACPAEAGAACGPAFVTGLDCAADKGLAQARLRPAGSGAAAFATIGLAQPKQAQPAKAGGARRDRTA